MCGNTALPPAHARLLPACSRLQQHLCRSAALLSLPASCLLMCLRPGVAPARAAQVASSDMRVVNGVLTTRGNSSNSSGSLEVRPPAARLPQAHRTSTLHWRACLPADISTSQRPAA